MRPILFILARVFSIVLPFQGTQGQPYIDLLNIQYSHSPDFGIGETGKHPTTLEYFSVQTTVPLQLKNKKDAIILSPFFDTWSPCVESHNSQFNNQYGIALPVSYLKTLHNEDWTIISTLIIRRNGSSLGAHDNWQFGGAMIASFKANETLRYKAGLYANDEFFGLFLMPLIGIDWQISRSTNLFGMLPGNLVMEHKVAKGLYAGASFRAITNSYKIPGGFWRLDENRLGIFADYYFSKNILFNLEAGHSILRKMRTGVNSKEYQAWNVRDNVYFKTAIAYRIRLR